MNLVNCLAGDNDTVTLGEVSVGVPPELAKLGKGRTALKFGIRPENISLAPQPDCIAVSACVVITEPLGAETLVTFRIGDSELIARCHAGFDEPPETEMQVYLSRQHMHLFDGETGTALRS